MQFQLPGGHLPTQSTRTFCPLQPNYRHCSMLCGCPASVAAGLRCGGSLVRVPCGTVCGPLSRCGRSFLELGWRAGLEVVPPRIFSCICVRRQTHFFFCLFLRVLVYISASASHNVTNMLFVASVASAYCLVKAWSNAPLFMGRRMVAWVFSFFLHNRHLRVFFCFWYNTPLHSHLPTVRSLKRTRVV